ncbi:MULTISPECIES: ComF family protein [unclassified Pseudodesulfovibrio]|uniref:ComF family protein n=1 Tax=unclassified Pseudodesulfovibrio TaxID=2661612 RepID=UPI000FEBF335|nr:MULTISPECIES: ComF family protein [unclassified Pseudodesulfovibrio]MCJ2163586.1 ComF family protein [Pseudodesulfovibrio sp. S3-i]RWU06820.1 ComF family protein [Pseudodesulfovibrio sp. S3]
MLRTALSLARRLGLTAVRCPVCGMVLADQGQLLCTLCAERLPLRTGGFCPTCGLMHGQEDAPPSQCPDCRLNPPPWDAMHFHGQYAGLMRELIISYKFGNRFGHTRLLAAMAAQTFHKRQARVPDVIIPVPLHHRRLLWRGFNQSLEVSRSLSRNIGKPVLGNGLTRTRHTPPQTRLGLKERQVNIKDAFYAAPEQVKDKRVLLVDDVYTTGATLRECARTLMRAGAGGVDVLVLARALQEPT